MSVQPAEDKHLIVTEPESGSLWSNWPAARSTRSTRRCTARSEPSSMPSRTIRTSVPSCSPVAAGSSVPATISATSASWTRSAVRSRCGKSAVPCSVSSTVRSRHRGRQRPRPRQWFRAGSRLRPGGRLRTATFGLPEMGVGVLGGGGRFHRPDAPATGDAANVLHRRSR